MEWRKMEDKEARKKILLGRKVNIRCEVKEKGGYESKETKDIGREI